MVKHTSIKRVSTASTSVSKSIDVKARKRIEELFELTDEIINAYNEINEKYVSEIFRKYRKLQDVNKRLRHKLNNHHCSGCKCISKPHENNKETESTIDDDDEAEDIDEDEDEDDNYSPTKKVKSSTARTSARRTRSNKSNPFIISDVEDTQNFDANDSRFQKNPSGIDEDQTTMVTNRNLHNGTKTSDELGEEIDENNDDDDDDDDNTMGCLPIALQNVIQRKASKNTNAKSYLLKIPLYPALCEYLVDKSRTSFDHRPSETQVRPLIANHISSQLANDSKMRMRIRDELREIHRSYMRTFMKDPHSAGFKSTNQKYKQLNVKISPM